MGDSTIFGLQMIKSGLENICLKFIHAHWEISKNIFSSLRKIFGKSTNLVTKREPLSAGRDCGFCTYGICIKSQKAHPYSIFTENWRSKRAIAEM